MLKTTDSQILSLVNEGTAEFLGRPAMYDDYEILAISSTLMLLYSPGTTLKIVPRSEVEDTAKK